MRGMGKARKMVSMPIDTPTLSPFPSWKILHSPCAHALELTLMLSFPHSLANNNLAGETGYVKKSKVQGSSFECGAKVTYEGREMTVSRAPDRDGNMTMIDLSGVMALAASLPECGLTSLECAAAPKRSPFCQPP